MTNSSFFDRDLQGQKALDNKVRTSSFNLLLFKINTFWDEGCGYDYQQYEGIQPNDTIVYICHCTDTHVDEEKNENTNN